MTPRAHIDFEWRSAIDIKKAGLYRQMEHPSTTVWCMSWRIGSTGPVNRWRPGWADPIELLEHVTAGHTVVSHNTTAERVAWNLWVRKRIAPHWPKLTREQMNCTMARCAALAIPQSMEMAAHALSLAERKDMAGSALMKKMAKPRTRSVCPACEGCTINRHGDDCPACAGLGEVYTWWDEPANIEKLMAYCDQDIETETALDARVPELSASERRVWLLNQKINDRGVALDIPLIHRAMAVVDHAKAQLDARMNEVTNGYVKKCSEAKKIAEFLTARGIPCMSVAKDEQEDLLINAKEINDDVAREAIELRQQASKASTSKLKSMLACVCADGRARGLLFYHGASSGREAGRLIQPQNLYRTDPERDGSDIELTIRLLQSFRDRVEAHDAIDCILGNVLTAIAKCMRSMFVAAEGKHFVGADLANIEGRGSAWLVRAEWKLEAFRAYDAGTGPDLYKVAYAESFGIPIEQVVGQKRQIGKVEELALGYQGSVGAFINMGKNYGLKPADLVMPVFLAVGAAAWCEVAETYEKQPNKHDLNIHEWTACKLVVNRWRKANPEQVQGWWDLQDAAIEAVANPGVMVEVFGGRVRYLYARDFLWCAIPSGRVLAYCRPWIKRSRGVTVRMPSGDLRTMDQQEVEEWSEVLGPLEVVDKGRDKRQVIYESYDSTKRRFMPTALYGGMQFNHVVQGFSRDVLFEGAFAAEDAGYEVVLDIHDELLNECPLGFGVPAELEELMCVVPSWASGLPLSAKAWEDVRYAK